MMTSFKGIFGNVLQNAGTRVEVVGNAPVFRVTNLSQNNSNGFHDYFTLDFDHGIREEDPDGNIEQLIPNFSGQPNLQFQPPYLAFFGNTSGTCLSYNGTLVLGDAAPTLELRLCLADYYGQVPYGSVDDVIIIDVPQYSVKLSILISNWPFLASENLLYLNMYINLQGDGKLKIDDKNKDEKKLSYQLQYPNQNNEDPGNGFYNLLGNVLTDDALLNTPFYSEGREESSSSGDKIEIRYFFPSFQKNLYYDPVFGFSNESAKGLSGGAIAGLVVGVVFAAAIFFISIAFYLARKKAYTPIQ